MAGGVNGSVADIVGAAVAAKGGEEERVCSDEREEAKEEDSVHVGDEKSNFNLKSRRS